MYTEFIIMYVGLGIVIALQIALTVIGILILKKLGKGNARPVSYPARPAAGAAPAATAASTVFCRGCAKQFDGSMRFCPYCGTTRT